MLRLAIALIAVFPFAAAASSTAHAQLPEFGDGVAYREAEEYDKALPIIRANAEAGSLPAQALLGDMYLYGEGAEKNVERAVHWYRVAALRGSGWSREQLGDLLPKHQEYAEDSDEILKWLRAKRQQKPEARYMIRAAEYFGGKVPRDTIQAFEWYAEKARQGDAEATYRACRHGLYLDKVTPDDFLPLCEASAKSGSLQSQFLMASALFQLRATADETKSFIGGHGDMARDPAQAMRWYLSAAEGGHKDAQANLAMIYALGLDVPRDEAKAVFWARKAAAQKHNRGMALLGLFLARGLGVERDDGQAVEWLKRAAAKRSFMAKCALGYIYLHGRGVPQDYVEAAAWLDMPLPPSGMDRGGWYGDLPFSACARTYAYMAPVYEIFDDAKARIEQRRRENAEKYAAYRRY